MQEHLHEDNVSFVAVWYRHGEMAADQYININALIADRGVLLHAHSLYSAYRQTLQIQWDILEQLHLSVSCPATMPSAKGQLEWYKDPQH